MKRFVEQCWTICQLCKTWSERVGTIYLMSCIQIWIEHMWNIGISDDYHCSGRGTFIGLKSRRSAHWMGAVIFLFGPKELRSKNGMGPAVGISSWQSWGWLHIFLGERSCIVHVAHRYRWIHLFFLIHNHKDTCKAMNIACDIFDIFVEMWTVYTHRCILYTLYIL